MSRKTFSLTTPLYYPNDVPHAGHCYTTIAADVIARCHRLQGFDVFFLTGTDENAEKVAEAAQKRKKTPKQFVNKIAKEFQKTWEKLNIDYDGFIRTTDQKHWKFVEKFMQKIYNNGDIYKAKYQGLYCPGCEAFVKETDLVNGLCPYHKKAPQRYSENNYFFRLAKYQNKLIELIESDQIMVRPEIRKKEILGKLKLGLEDISISRTNTKWGIPLPFDPSQRCYCWIEALQGYLSGTPSNYWPISLHLLAKDILWFHSVIFEALLLSAQYPLPKMIFAHGFFTINGQKMSKSLKNVISPKILVQKFGTDGTRYLMLSEFPFGADGDISLKKFEIRYNADLANGLGNLVARVAKLCENSGLKFKKTKLPKAKYTKAEQEAFENCRFDTVLKNIFIIYSSLIDKHINQHSPWHIKDKNTLQGILQEEVDELRKFAIKLQPFLPVTAQKIERQFAGPKIKAGKPLFPRLK